jgi:hypothetical protein
VGLEGEEIIEAVRSRQLDESRIDISCPTLRLISFADFELIIKDE